MLLCLPIAIGLATLPLIGATTQRNLWMESARFFALAQWVLLLLAFCLLANAFLSDDFSVKLVAMHSNTALPLQFKFSALWGNHEGSLLLWVFVLSSWTLAVALFSGNLPLDIRARVLSVLGMISVGFLLFIIFTSNPFERMLLNTLSEGKDLNPLLQDIGLILHPPILYLGYVGFSVAFAFAITALMTGQLDTAWARWSRPWTNAAWAFLTIGIALGSWWAYYELGWGGWWFWDPVENASFMPWLAGTALIHSLAATEKRGVFRSWTVLLAILAFSLSLLGTFLVRSGILVSVHAFASDPERGLFILAFLVVVIGGSLLLYALRAPAMQASAKFGFYSREAGILANNLLLSVALFIVLLGTLYPLVMSALELGSYSVGPPYFNALFIPVMVVLIVLMGFAPYLQWKRANPAKRHRGIWIVIALLSLVVASLLAYLLARQYEVPFNPLVLACCGLVLWLVLTTLNHLRKTTSNGRGRGLTLRHRLGRLSPSYCAMIIAHLGIAVTALGVGLTSIYSEQRDMRMLVGDSVVLRAYEYRLDKISRVDGPNYSSSIAEISVFSATKKADLNGSRPLVSVLYPEKRFYYAARNVMTEAGIDATLSRDLYVALGEELEGGAWAVRVHVKPYVRCIWLGALMMAAGGFLSIADKRYRIRKIAVGQA